MLATQQELITAQCLQSTLSRAYSHQAASLCYPILGALSMSASGGFLLPYGHSILQGLQSKNYKLWERYVPDILQQACFGHLKGHLDLAFRHLVLVTIFCIMQRTDSCYTVLRLLGCVFVCSVQCSDQVAKLGCTSSAKKQVQIRLA